MPRKIAVVGASIEGFLQLALLINFRRGEGSEHFSDDVYTLIHDPDKVYPYLTNGVSQLFYETLEREIPFTVSFLKKYCNGVDVNGYKYVGWGNRTDKNFVVSGNNITFDVEKFRQKFIENGGKVFGPNCHIIEQSIDSFEVDEDKCSINGVDYDFVIDCTEKNPLGWEDDYMSPSVDFTNSFVMYTKPIAGDFDFIFEYAGKYGHMIGMPLIDKQIWVYCYDNNINTEEQVREDFASIFPDEDVTNYETNTHSWRPRISNYVMHPNKRYFRNGNALMNIEPCMARSQTCELSGEFICRYLFADTDRGKEETAHLMMINYQGFVLSTVQAFMSFSYQYGSRHDTEFWNNIESRSAKYLDNPCFKHPTILPGKPFRNEMLNEKFQDEDFKLLHHQQNMVEQSILPYRWMENLNMFYDYALGLGAPYAHYMNTFADVDPPEPFGTIGYDLT